MRLSDQQLHNEHIYVSTMTQVEKLLRMGLISEAKYWQINTRMKEKYHPISDGLLTENELLFTTSRG